MRTIMGLMLVVFLLLPVGCGSDAEAFELTSGGPMTVKYMAGVSLDGDDKGGTVNALIGPVRVLMDGDTELMELGVIDLGLGTRFGGVGDSLTTHIGLGVCVADRLVCLSSVHNIQDSDVRMNVTVDMVEMLKKVPMVGDWF